MLGYVGLCWVGLGWVGLGWVGLGWFGLVWFGLGWVGLDQVGLGWVAYDSKFLYKNKFTHKKFYEIALGIDTVLLGLIYTYVRFRIKLAGLKTCS